MKKGGEAEDKWRGGRIAGMKKLKGKVRKISGEMEERRMRVFKVGEKAEEGEERALTAVRCLCFSLHLSVISITVTIMAPIHSYPTPVTLWLEKIRH